MKVAQPRGQGANAVEARRAKDEAAQFVLITDAYIEPTKGLASLLGQLAALGSRAGQGLNPRAGRAPGCFAIADAERAPGLPIEEAVAGPQVQIRVIEQQPHGDAAQLRRTIFAGGLLPQAFIERVQDPTVLVL